jgi:hypothetical protein
MKILTVLALLLSACFAADAWAGPDLEIVYTGNSYGYYAPCPS